MPMKLMALVRQEVIDYLSGNIAAKLDNIDARFGDFVLDDIVNFYKSDASVDSVMTFPIIIVPIADSNSPIKANRWARILIGCARRLTTFGPCRNGLPSNGPVSGAMRR